jgi:predicted dehydrogenase
MSWARDLSPQDARRLFADGDVYRVAPDEARQAKRALRVAVLGAGGVAQAKHLPALAELATRWEPVELAGVATLDAAQGAKLRAIWRVPAYRDAATLLAHEAPDAVIVAAPDAAHHDLAIEALEAGADVLIEKPLAPDAAAARAIVERAASLGRLVLTVANKRYSPPYLAAARWLDDGRIGAPRLLAAKLVLGYDYVDVLGQGTVHLLDLLRLFAGDVADVRAIAAAGAPRDHFAVTLRFRSGAVGTLTTSAGALSLHPWERLEVFGDGPWLGVEDQGVATLHPGEGRPAETWTPVVPNTLVSGLEWGGYVGMLEEWLDAVRGSPPRVAAPEDGLRAVELVAAIRASAAEGGCAVASGAV